MNKGQSGVKSIINAIKIKVIELKIGLGMRSEARKLKDYQPEVREVSMVVGEFIVPALDGDHILTWSYEKECVRVADPRFYGGVFDSVEEEQAYLDARASRGARHSALLTLEEANLIANCQEASDVIIEAYNQLLDTWDESEINRIVNETQEKINKYREIKKEEFDGYKIGKN